MCLLILTISSLNHGGAAYSEEPVEQPHVVVNEIEINPPGFDTGNEWVELYNPTNKPIDLEGWRISYTHRGPGTEIIATEPTFIEPGGYFVHTYTGLRLTNANPGVVQLIAPDGTVVDQTAPFSDSRDDEKTWQRFPDGGDPLWPDLWFFLPATPDKTNN